MSDIDASTEVHGFVAPGYEEVAAEFERNLQSGQELGAAFAAVSHGQTVVDLWGGRTGDEHRSLWSRETLCPIFSGSKGLCAICVLRLIDAGALELEAPVAKYWPRFGAEGKQDVLVRHVMSHTAGLPGVLCKLSYEQVPDGRYVARCLERQAPLWPAGSRICYHSLTYGWLCNELVRSVTGLGVGEYFRAEIATPLGLELWLGLPRHDEPRVARCHLAKSWRGVSSPTGDIAPEHMRAIYHNPDLFPTDRDLPWNRPDWHAGEIPGANGIGTARSIATLYGLLSCGGSRDGFTLLSGEAIELGQRPLAEGVDPCDGDILRYGVGWALQEQRHLLGPPERAFGHPGAGGSQHGAWPELGVGFSYTMNLMRDDEHDGRVSALLRALHRRCSAGSRRRA
jgi:CubicO group peptidase (beta-lactamase class C family)